MRVTRFAPALSIILPLVLAIGPGAVAGPSLDGVTSDLPTAPVTLPDDLNAAGSEVVATPSLAEEEEEAHAAASSSGSVVDLDVLGSDALTLSESSSSAGQSSSGGSSSGGSSSDATLLAVLGQELWGAHANSEEGANEREGLLLDVTDQVCAGTGGQLCVSLLYEERTSNEDGNSEEKSIASVCAGGEQTQASHDCDGPISLTIGYAGASANADENGSESSSDTALVDACVGSEAHSASDTCSGPVGGRVAESHSDSAATNDDPDQGDKSAESGAENSGAEVCVGGEAEESGMCDGLGAVILHSESFSSANTKGKSASEGLAQTLVVEASGEEAFSISEEATVALPPDCPDLSVVCLFLNQVASEAGAGAAGGRATAIAAEVGRGILGEDAILSGTVDDSASQVDLGDQVKGKIVKPKAPQVPSGPGSPSVLAGPDTKAGLLPFTGANLSVFLLLAFMLLGAGIVLSRRTGVISEDR